MKREDILDSISYVDPALIREADAYTPAGRSNNWRRWGALAACLCVIAAAAVIVPRLINRPTADNETVTQYRLPDMGGDGNDWFYNKYNRKVSTIDGAWFDTVGADVVSDWCDRYDREKKAGTANTDSPMLVQFITDCHIPENVCREVMDTIRKSEEEFGTEPVIRLTDEEISTIYSGSSRQINETFASAYCIVVDGDIYTPEWLLNHPVSAYKSCGITYGRLKEKVDGQYAAQLSGNDEFLALYEKKLHDLRDIGAYP